MFLGLDRRSSAFIVGEFLIGSRNLLLGDCHVRRGTDATRRNTHTGRPLVVPEFIETIERLLKRKLKPQPGGRPPKLQPDARQSMLAF